MPVLIVGDPADPHVQAVADRLPKRGTVIIDAVRQSEVVQRLEPGCMRLIDVSGATVDVRENDLTGRGWVRRLAPAGWDHGVTLGSHAAAVLSSRLALLAAILRDPSLTWLTPVDLLFAAENKLVQYRAAMTAALRVPATLMSGSAADLGDELGDPFVLKPLGPGHFQDEGGRQQVVYVREVRAADLAGTDLLDAPFLAQKIVSARAHLRVVTVRDRAWVAELDASRVPLDWREHAPAHRHFTASNRWPEVEQAAVSLAATLQVGYSSQDWVVDQDGPVFLDLNPGGQWLFLPEPVATSVAQAIADYLAGN